MITILICINNNWNHPKIIKKSAEFIVFPGLVYLNYSELVEIYNTKINKRKLSISDKANWSYIKEINKGDPDTKFYIYVN